jgi:integrase
MDQRDQALIAFLLLTGIRYQAICSLSMACFDIEGLIVFQDPRRGVRTKGGKAITTRLLPFDNELIEIVIAWAKYLTCQRSFGPSDPLFPRTKISQATDGYAFEANQVEPVFWSGGNSIREILKVRSARGGLPYFQPHSFRHAACQLCLKGSRTPEELKALSQNFGHEAVTTTLRSYGTLDQERVGDVISRISFSRAEINEEETEAVEQFKALLRKARKSP